ncbi:DUF4360 domain-containing protein [Pseudobacteriovorax antillogorgiicola]|uniref:Secreted protein n=1 Tax=Pseudobacteriovorax antillogorgiicola TaxID=1513793 RepID=A0A1Y6CSR5_9BACT|nr:DUF4360 domain-containing protein [Pseudobacteriovorax antillogorgiicola]TCS45916.1 uncharacterized protein DUF4360 [Pseudobacteriovorax antillogorgiicola]SMF71065.1 protein of unknown function [Pseudobacteriovorax antillogorgiicola]
MKFVFAFIISLISASAYSQLQLGDLNINGSGCNEQTTRSFVEGEFLKVSFLDFETQTLAGERFDRKNCNIAINASVEPGFQVKFDDIRLIGFASVNQGSNLDLYLDSFFSGTMAPVLKETVYGPSRSGFEFGRSLNSPWSPCGQQDMIIRLNTSMAIKGEKSYSRMNTLSSGIKVRFKKRRC